MASSSVRPCLVVADSDGNIFDIPDRLMVCRNGADVSLPRPEELIPLPEESELFLLPARHALGLDPETGELEEQEELAVAAFAAPAHTLTAHPAYKVGEDAPVLPLFAYGAVGFYNNRFYITAKKVDDEPRQEFTSIPRGKLEKEANKLLKQFPENRLIQHIVNNCALTYTCPAARNLCLGRYEAPLPVSVSCNARCIGCISKQEENSKICASPQNRMTFTPSAEEIVQVMSHHSANVEKAIFSFGQGCEGEPLTQAPLIAEAITMFRESGGKGTININSNASLPASIENLAKAGLTSLRVSLNSARPEPYSRYYRPQGYSLDDVKESIRQAKEHGVYVSLNLLFFPGFTDTEEEVSALLALVEQYSIDCIQLRNLNIDPDMYMELMQGISTGPAHGFSNFRKRIKKTYPQLHLGYFNPFVE